MAPIYSVFLYDGIVRDAIHALKYRGGQDVVEPLSSRMAESWHDRGLQSDLLVPVPLHESREAERGYNQSALLARALAPRVGVPSEEALLFRVRRTASQTKLSQAERWHNVRDAFACVETYDLSNLSLTLVDDVATTGATLDACAVALLDRGARVVNAFTLARAA
ncbi:MAG: ComF family protein [Anaerolineae bacterium]